MSRAPKSCPIVRRAFTLIESVICVVVLALAVPPTLELMNQVSADRADAVNTERAATLAQSLLETVLADVASNHENLGFTALNDASTYSTGFQSRTASLTAAYAAVGMEHQLQISGLVDRTGSVNLDASENIFRTVTVVITFPSARGEDYVMPMAIVVGDL